MSHRHLQKDTAALWLSWLLPAVILLLVSLFSVVIIRDYGRESESARQTLQEKGNVLLHALESGARVGMGMHMRHTQLQTLLEEMAWQPGVIWFAVTNEQGRIIAHSDPQQVGKTLYDVAEMRELDVTDSERWRRIGIAGENGESIPALEIYRQFRPQVSGRHRMHGLSRGGNDNSQPKTPQVIFIAFDASELDATHAREWRNMIMMLCALGAVVLATVLAIFWFRRYLRSRRLLSETINRKEKLMALGHLAAGVAHEIRNPLSSIKGLAKYFAERVQAGGEEYKLAQVMAKEADRLNRVVSDLLELVRPAHLKLQKTCLNTVITHSLQLVSQDARSRNIQLQFNERTTLCPIQADPDRLTQVLLNLYLNAIHAIGHDGTIAIEVSECEAKRVKITIKDSGKGIAPEHLAEIFTPYFTTKADGTGLGLAVVQNIVEQHGGTIHAESKPGEGACFIIYLPVNTPQKDAQG